MSTLNKLLKKAGLLDDWRDIERGIKEGRKDVERAVKKAKGKLKDELMEFSIEDLALVLPIIAPGAGIALGKARTLLAKAEKTDLDKVVGLLKGKVESLGDDKIVELVKKVQAQANAEAEAEIAALIAALKAA